MCNYGLCDLIRRCLVFSTEVQIHEVDKSKRQPNGCQFDAFTLRLRMTLLVEMTEQG